MGKVGTQCHESFIVLDSTAQPVLSLTESDFTTKLIDPSGSDSTNVVSITELSDGLYRVSFTPTSTGKWIIVVFNSTYFPEGKMGEIEVFNYTVDDIYDNTVRILGLSQENYYIDQNIYDANGNATSCRIRLYSNSASVGTINNVIATYTMAATYIGTQLSTYKVTKN